MIFGANNIYSTVPNLVLLAICFGFFFFCVGVVYSGEYDVCDVTLSVYPHRASLKNMPGHGGNRTYDLWNTSPMLCQLSYAVRTVRVSDISEQNLVPSIPVYSSNMIFSVLVLCTQVNMMFVMLL